MLKKTQSETKNEGFMKGIRPKVKTARREFHDQVSQLEQTFSLQGRHQSWCDEHMI